MEVVHANIAYTPEGHQHQRSPYVRGDYYPALGRLLSRAMAQGSTVLYQPNVNGFTSQTWNNEVAQHMLDTDPALTNLDNPEGVIVHPAFDHADLALESLLKRVQVENDMIKRHGRAVVLGAYVNECVPVTAANIQARNPAYQQIGADYLYSIDRGAPSRNAPSVPAVMTSQILDTGVW